MRPKIPQHVLRPSPGQSLPRLPAAVAFMALVVLVGCAGGGPAQQATPPTAPPPPTDPVVAFAAQAQPGAESRILLASGQSTPARLARSYNAASGRECREVVLGTGAAQRSQLVCKAEHGGWVAARPLLRGGGTSRP
jgi:hypothetical protein